MSKTIKRTLIVIAVVVIVLLVLPRFFNVNSFRPTIESELSRTLGREAAVGELSLSILSGSVSAADIRIADDPAFSNSAFLTAKSLKIGVELMPLIFSKQLKITGITLEEPSAALLSNQSGKWNFSSLGSAQPKTEPQKGGSVPPGLSVQKFKITGGKIQIGKANAPGQRLTIENVSLEVKDFSTTSQFPFILTADMPGGGSLKLDGKAGPIAPAGTPVQATVRAEKLDLASLGADPGVGLGGIGNMEGTLDSDGKIAKMSGTLSVEKLKLSPKGAPAGREIKVKMAADLDLGKDAGRLSQADVTAGKAVAHLTGNFRSEGERTVVGMALNAPAMPVDDIEALLPAFGVTLPAGTGLRGGTLSVKLDITGPTHKLVITGPVKLENTSLTGFDLGSKLSAISALTGKTASSKDTTIQNASMNTRMAPEGTSLDAINVAVPALGVLTGAGSVSPTGALNFRMMADLSGGVAGGVTQIAGGRGGSGVPFLIEGTTSNPKFVPDVKGMAGSAAKGAVDEALGTKGLGGLFKKR